MAMKLGKLAIIAAGLYAANKYFRKKPTPTPVGPNKKDATQSTTPVFDSMATPPIVSPRVDLPTSPAPNVSQGNIYVAPAELPTGAAPQFTSPGYGVSGFKRRLK